MKRHEKVAHWILLIQMALILARCNGGEGDDDTGDDDLTTEEETTEEEPGMTGDYSVDDADFIIDSDIYTMGKVVSSGGDVDGDGLEDMVVWGYVSGEGGTEQNFFILSGREEWEDTVLIGSALHRISYEGSYVPLVSRLILDASSDVNGDGLSDILMGDPYRACSSTHSGGVYFFAGRIDWPETLSIEDADAYLCGENQWDEMGYVVSPGDVNGDGFSDILISSFENDTAGFGSGKVYLLPGGNWGLSGELDPSSGLATFLGESTGDSLGYPSSPGDFNGDGIGDLVVASPYNGVTTGMKGKIYLIYGKSSGWSLDTPISSADATFTGVSDLDNSGKTNLLADIDGDSFSDLVVGSYPADVAGFSDCGMVYMIRGREGLTGETSLSSADFSYRGEKGDDYLGYAMDTGFLNNDQMADLLIGACQYDSGSVNDVGRVYLFYGKREGWGQNESAYSADVTFTGVQAGGKLGVSIASGDINGDGRDDIIMGAESIGGAGGGYGRFYIFFGM